MFSQSLGNLVVHLSANTSKYTASMKAAQSMLNKTATVATAAGRKMAMGITLPLAALGAGAIKSFGDFDAAMTQSLAIMGNVSEGMRKEMEDTAKTISSRSKTAPEDLAESYFFLASAGLSAEQSVKALATVEKFSVAGNFNMARATDLLTDAQSALGLTVSDATKNMENMNRISDVLVKANTLANASVEQFSTALTNKAAAALRLLNKDVEEGVAVLAAFADQGVKDVAAGEKLYIVLRDLQSASLKNENAWRKMNMGVFDAQGQMLPLADIVEQLENKFARMSDKQKKATAEMLGFQDRSFIAIQNLIGMSGHIREYQRQLYKAGGITETVADKQLETFNTQMQILLNNLKLAGADIGESMAPSLQSVGEMIKSAMIAFRGLDQETKNNIVAIGVFAAALGIALLVIGKFASALSSIASVLSFIGLAGAKIIAVVGLVITAILMVTDALSGGALGINDWLKSIRIGFLKIGSYFEAILSYGEQFAAMMLIAMMTTWEELKVDWARLMEWLYRTSIIAAKSIASVFDNIFGTSYSKNMEKNIAKSIAAEEKLANKKKDLNKVYFSLQKRNEEKYEELRNKYIYQADIDERNAIKNKAKEEEKKFTKQMKQEKIKEKAEKLKAELQKLLDKGAATGGMGSGSGSTEFQSMSLRRFALGPVGTSNKKKQQVRDEGVIQAIHELRHTIETKPSGVTLG